MILAYAMPVSMLALGWVDAWVLLPLLTVPWATRLARSVAQDRGPPLNRTLAGTAKLLSAYGVLFAVGIAL